MVLYGREVEQARLAALVDQAREGRAGTVLLRGEPGVGKSALLADLVAGPAVTGMRVLRTQGLESESPLAYGGLHRLLRPLLGRLERLPAPQANALRVAFGSAAGPSVEPFLVGVATLSMLTEAAEETPVLCVADDAHWLDPASMDALMFAARRLAADRVAIVIAARDTDVGTVDPGVETWTLRGLDPAAGRSLLADQVGDHLTDAVLERLLVETGGNPLALLELPTALTEAQRAGTAPLPTRLPVGTGVERVFLDRVRRLPAPLQTLMLVAAADDTGRLSTIRRAAERLGVDARDWEQAERSGLLSTDGDRVQVRHPLVRSAIYQSATGFERRRVHQALADCLDDQPDRQTWHRAAAADGPNETVASALAEVARRAESRGGYLTAAGAYERAAELSASQQLRAARRYAAAQNAWEAGQPERATALMPAAREQADDPLLRADIDRLRGRLEVNLGSASTAHGIFVAAARAVAEADPARALEMAMAAAVLRNHGADSGARLDTAAITTDRRLDDGPRTRCLIHLLAAMTAPAAGDWAGGLAALRRALADGVESLEDLDLWGNLGNAALHLGDDEAARRCYSTMLTGARQVGAGMAVVYALQRLAFSQLLAGQWSDLRVCAGEALNLSRSVGQPAMTATPLAWLTLLAALQGQPDYETLLAQVQVVAQRPLGVLTEPVQDLTRWAMGVRAGQQGDAAAAFHHLSRVRLPTLTRMATLDRIEAAVRAAQIEQATSWTREMSRYAEMTGWAWALAAADHGRALLADPADAPALFESSLAHHARAARPYDEARTRLAYGEFLRRSQRRVDARLQLRLALETFADLQAEPLAARATGELRASGETARRRDPSTLLALTPTELKVAQLVSRGLSNKEVATQCWVSPRTVAFHLRNVFAKTAVTSRGELAQLDLG